MDDEEWREWRDFTDSQRKREDKMGWVILAILVVTVFFYVGGMYMGWWI